MKKERYSVQKINSKTDGVNYRITDNNSDSRISTSYSEDNANFIVDRLNLVDELFDKIEAYKKILRLAGVPKLYVESPQLINPRKLTKAEMVVIKDWIKEYKAGKYK